MPHLEILGARENNLKNIHLKIPRNALVVITGISGSGKSSLAFDTIHAEGQRRYMESFSSYARSFIGNLKRPDVDKIEGLSPVIAIEQRTTSRNTRSTVGTATEIYDFLRLLFARAADAYSYATGEKMVRYTPEEIRSRILQEFAEQKIILLAPVVRGRKGEYKRLLENLRRKGYLRVRIDGKLKDLTSNIKLSRYKVHDIEVVIDKFAVGKVESDRFETAIKDALQLGEGVLAVEKSGSKKLRYFSKFLMCPSTGIAYNEPAPNLFSFNSNYGACSVCMGLGTVKDIDVSLIEKESSKSLSQALKPFYNLSESPLNYFLRTIYNIYNIPFRTPIGKLPANLWKIILYGSEYHPDSQSNSQRMANAFAAESKIYDGLIHELGIYADEVFGDIEFEGIVPFFLETIALNRNTFENKSLEPLLIHKECPECKGARLCTEALFYKIDGKNIAELAQMNLNELADWFRDIEQRLTKRQNAIARDVLKEIRKRVRLINNLGLSYLTLNASIKMLSGGELQRIRLATQIGTQLVGVLYILDEPSIGLHQRDNAKLIKSLQTLRDLGNSVIVVEHDKETMLAADFLIDIGPGAGKHGGEVITASPISELRNTKTSTTIPYLLNEQIIPVPTERRKGTGESIKIRKASGNNLKQIDATFPLGTFICVTGVSGSGKSTLIDETLYPAIANHLYKDIRDVQPFESMEGVSNIDKVIEIDQSPIGRTSRSNPATYTGVFTPIRTLYKELPEAKLRGFKPGRFSFNVKGGRCEVCKGVGKKLIEMEFLPDIYVDCEECKGKRYNRETLEVRYRGKSIADVLDMSVDEALTFFEKHPRIHKILETLQNVGLGYITLGQHSTLLSGGEAQRVKLSSELAKRDTGKTFYILDEPTTGLHFQDIILLTRILKKLVAKNNTVLVIEHNMDIIKTADYVIDLGPEGGEEGGYIVAEGTPEEIVKISQSHTGRFLKRELH